MGLLKQDVYLHSILYYFVLDLRRCWPELNDYRGGFVMLF